MKKTHRNVMFKKLLRPLNVPFIGLPKFQTLTVILLTGLFTFSSFLIATDAGLGLLIGGCLSFLFWFWLKRKHTKNENWITLLMFKIAEEGIIRAIFIKKRNRYIA